MPKNDGQFDDGEEQEDSSPKLTSYTLLAIDQYVVPSKFCMNGHIVEWKNEENGVTVSYLRQVNTDTMTAASICMVCGQPAVQEPQDAPSEEAAG